MSRSRFLVCFIVFGIVLQSVSWAMASKSGVKDMENRLNSVSSADLSLAVNVRDFGAKADGVSDDTAAIQKALNHAQQHGPVCFLPAGHYRINGSLAIPKGVTLSGADGGVAHPKSPYGTVLLIYGGKGNENGEPAIILDWSSTITRVTIHYPEQLPPPNVVAYPWTIQGRGQLCQVVDVTMTNPYKAIDFGTYKNELHMIRNVFACPLKIGVYIDQCYDVGRVENVHFNPNFWKRMQLQPKFPTGGKTDEDEIEMYQNNLLSSYLEKNFIGFKIGKTDWEYMTNCFVIFAKAGFEFDDYGNGTGNALVTQSGSDVGPLAVQINKSQPHAGIEFVNCQFMATIKIGKENKGAIKISNSGFWPISSTQEQIIKDGPGSLILSACHFADWDMTKEGKPCIYVKGGRIAINGCDFEAEKTAILFDQGVAAGTVVGNMFRGAERMLNKSDKKIEAGFNTEQ